MWCFDSFNSYKTIVCFRVDFAIFYWLLAEWGVNWQRFYFVSRFFFFARLSPYVSPTFFALVKVGYIFLSHVIIYENLFFFSQIMIVFHMQSAINFVWGFLAKISCSLNDLGPNGEFCSFQISNVVRQFLFPNSKAFSRSGNFFFQELLSFREYII